MPKSCKVAHCDCVRTVTVRVESVRYGRVSASGNPRAIFRDVEGNDYRTGTDYAVGWDAGNVESAIRYAGKPVTVTLHIDATRHVCYLQSDAYPINPDASI